MEPSLREHFGFPAFRPGQREACEAALAGRDVLVVMPTGSGKSLCYQLPALLRDDLTIVVSPLVSLMQDQVDALGARGLGARVALVNAQQDAGANAEAVARAAAGDLCLLYVAPERFSSPGFVRRMKDARVGLFVVDEAHCVSQWGHDFRPDYFRLADAARYLEADAIVASTATATPRVAADIVRRLTLNDPLRVATGFDRPNLSFSVARPTSHEKHLLLLEALREPEALPAIVYAGTRAACEELAGSLGRELGVPCAAYHAGMDRDARAETQRAFMRGDVQVVVATNAFGMGVDKADVRFVCHADAPGSVDAYHQQFGRAGRDGLPARAHLLFRPADLSLRRFFAARGALEPRDVQRLLAALERLGREASTKELAQRARLGRSRTATALTRLADAGLISLLPDGTVQAADGDASLASAVEAAAEAVERHRLLERTRVEMLRQYAETRDCRRRFILNYFGQAAPEPCGNCDTCDAGLPQALEQERDLPFPINGSVRHPRFGPGRVVRYEDGRIVILFEDAGYRTLLTDAAVRAGRLRPAP